MHVHKHTMRELLEQVSKFWKISTFDKELFTECHLILKVGKLIVRYYFYMAFIGALLFMVQPFTTHQVPAVCYTPDGWFIYLTGIIWYLTCILIFLTMGTDGFFCTLATALTVQFKLLGHRFKVLKIRPGPKNEQQMWDEIKELVDYHNFLIRYFSTGSYFNNYLFHHIPICLCFALTENDKKCLPFSVSVAN
jgi:hypothetical protein